MENLKIFKFLFSQKKKKGFKIKPPQKNYDSDLTNDFKQLTPQHGGGA